MSSFFDEQAATWDDDPVKVERAQVVARAITDLLGLDGSQRLFEYGAGTGLVAQALRDVVGSITLADTSAGMRAVMDAKVAAGGLAGARVWDLDLEHQPAPDEQFDLVATVLALHHLHDVPTVLGRFTDLLAPGGAVCIVDLDAEDGSFHGHGADVHHGFDRGELAATMATAGLVDVEVRDCHHMERNGQTFGIFLAIGRAAR